ncbi:cation:proton antiporter [Candidatus Woesearchaeota archaeon]|nr:cation:proton antiporter [Candidatus Woesearchaeota archaeon]
MAFLTELGLIFLFSIIGGVLAVRFKQPTVLGLLLIGAITGQHMLGLVQDDFLIEASIQIGAILLLFTLGIEFSLAHLFNLGTRAVIVAIMKLGMVFFLSYSAAQVMGLDLMTSLFVGVILSITSTVVFMKVLEQKGMAKREEVPLLITVLIIEDIFGVFALTFFSSLNGEDLTIPIIATRLLVSLTLMAITYVILQRILRRVIHWLSKYSTEETSTFISLGLCGGMSYLALLFHLSPSVGAFLAGNIVSSLPNAKQFERTIHPFILTFTSLFFFSIGTIVNFSVILTSLLLVLVLLIINIVAKYIGVGLGSYLFANVSGRQAVFSGLAMISVGEFSLLIAKESTSVVSGIDLVSITAAIIFLSSISMSLLINHVEKIHTLTTRSIPRAVQENMTLISKFISSISLTMIRDTISMKQIDLDLKAIINNITAITIIAAVGVFVWRYFREVIASIIGSQYVLAVVLLFFLFLSSFPTLRVVRSTKNVLRRTLQCCTKLYPQEASSEKKIFNHVIILLLLFFILIVSPSTFAFITPEFAYLIEVFILTLILIYAFRSSRLIYGFTKKHESNLTQLSKKYQSGFVKKLKIAKSKLLKE